jgi:hypothetical protein
MTAAVSAASQGGCRPDTAAHRQPLCSEASVGSEANTVHGSEINAVFNGSIAELYEQLLVPLIF